MSPHPNPSPSPFPADSARTTTPLTAGDRVTLEITDLAFGGEGVGRIGDFVVFVPYLLPGERAEVKLTEVKRSFARGIVARRLSDSPERVEPRCEYFGECGGCQYQHLDYAAQLRWKRKQIADLFQRVGGFPAARVREVLPCPQPYGYRNRILVRSQWNRPAQKLNLGFVRADCGLVCDIESCAIAEPALNDAILDWRKNLPPKGGIKTLLRILEGLVSRTQLFPEQLLRPSRASGCCAIRPYDAGVMPTIDAGCGRSPDCGRRGSSG
ncbi:MAG: TRAM domain-containing protein [Verrucomicrobiota bacterium]